ncbi:MAG: hypothetical protein APR55_10580 [Methanolinea sp. SDB]|nr:MAG: hypothetical protein APR55_10580 [Methanolinea sp. SDB]
MKFVDKIFHNKIVDVKDSIRIFGGWSEKVREQLIQAKNGNKQAYSNLIDLIFENPIPVNKPRMSYKEVTWLLHTKELYTPPHEIDAVQTAAEYQVWHESINALISEIKETLVGFPSSRITSNNIEMIIDAAGYALCIFNSSNLHSHTPEGVPHLHLTVNNWGKENRSLEAVRQLCLEKTSLTTNILYKIRNKRDFSIKTGSCTSYSEQTVSFSEERDIAINELAQRGNPPFDLNNYFI